jgi:DNA invertase Pin-like site-specific DNA recombinase
MSRSITEVEDEIRQDVINVRSYLPQMGYVEKTIFKEGRRGLVYCALWELARPTATGNPAVGYGRVSSNMQSNNHSLATQIRQQLDLAAERGHTIRYVFVDAGVSGRDDRRPAFSRMMRYATRGDIAAVYAYDIYRFYRNMRGLVTQYGRLQENEVELISAAEKHTDFSSRDGKLLLYLKGIVGEVVLDDLSRTTRDNKYSRALKGYSNASQPPFGYCRGRCLDCTDPNGRGHCPRFGSPELRRELGDDPKVFMPHPVESVGFVLAAQWYATGSYSDKDVAQMLNDHEHQLEDGSIVGLRPKGRPGRAAPNRQFRKDSVRDMLQNPFYAGFVVYREMKRRKGRRSQEAKRYNPLGHRHGKKESQVMWLPGQHIPLISQELFERCLQVRGSKGHMPSSHFGRKVHVYPLTGILHCPRCDEMFRGNASHGTRYYEDKGRVQGIGDCPVRSVRAGEMEEEIFAYVEQLRIPEEWYSNILDYLKDDDQAKVLRQQRRSLESQLHAVQAEHRMKEISDGEYIQARRRLKRDVRQLARKDSSIQQDHRIFLEDFSRLWGAATPLERKTLVRCMFLHIDVLDGEITKYVLRDPFRQFFPPQ